LIYKLLSFLTIQRIEVNLRTGRMGRYIKEIVYICGLSQNLLLKKQFDAQFILSKFRQSLHVLGLSKPICGPG